MLELHTVSKRYPSGACALNEVTLSVPAGQVMALIGPSGAGKSTLIRCVNGVVTPSAGGITLMGDSLTGLSPARLRRARREISTLFQPDAPLARASVMENVLAGQQGYLGFWASWLRRFPAQDVARACELLARVGLGGEQDTHTDALSEEARQRVGIARALMQTPQLLLIDEPGARQAPRTARQILRLIGELCRERQLSAIINIHDVPLALRYADRVVGLRKGQVVYDGSPARLDAHALRAIYGTEDWQRAAEAPDVETGRDMPASFGPLQGLPA